MIVTDLFRSNVVAEAFEMPIVTGLLNPDTGRPYLPSELGKPQQAAGDMAGVNGSIPSATTATTTTTEPASSKFPGEDPQGAGYVGRREVARRQAARDAAAAKKPVTPNFAGPAGYSSVNYAPNIKTGISLPKPTVPSLTSAPAKVKPLAATTPTAGKAELVSIGGQKINPSDPLYSKIMQNVSAGSSTAANPSPYLAAVENTAIKNITDNAVNMLRTAQSKDDLAKVKTYIDREFAKQGNKYISEAMFYHRDRLIKHAVQIFQRRIS